MSYPTNPVLNQVFVNSQSEICIWNGTTWVCNGSPSGTGTPPMVITGYQVITLTNNQTTINLSSAVTNPNLTQVYVNGQKQRISVDYIFSTSSTITWLNADYALESTDTFEIYKV